MKLILLANGFPYGPWEPFLETEVNYYRGFDDVYVCAMQLRRAHMRSCRSLPSARFHVCPVPFSLAACIPGCFRALVSRDFYGELGRLFQGKRFSLTRLAWLFFYLSRSYHEAAVIGRYLKKQGLAGTDERVVLYSYRFDYQPYAALLLKKKYFPHAAVIARGHRYDLYEQARGCGYIPMRPYLLERLDRVALISADGMNYLAERYPAWRDKLTVSLLGTEDHGPGPDPAGPFRLVSCSALTANKRVALIAQALAGITDRPIVWTHYGDGPLMAQVRALCEKLPANVRWELPGRLDNAALMAQYARRPAHLFVNASDSEGIPVSIMEAMSFAIPCIATDVGGTREIVRTGKNGTLLPADVSAGALRQAILSYADMAPADCAAYRARARAFWRERYSARENYAAFAAWLERLGAGDGGPIITPTEAHDGPER